MSYEIEIPKAAALPLIAVAIAGAWFLKPAEFRRDPLIELQGVIGMAGKYEVMYARCTDGTGKATLDAGGLAKGFVGGYSHRFPARHDADAIAFAAQARPQCKVASLYKLHRRTSSASSAGTRYRRTPVDIS